MKKRNTLLSLLAFLLMGLTASAQTFNGSNLSTAGTANIPSAGTGGCTVAPQITGGTIFQATVAGLGANTPLASVVINLNHTFDSDLDIYLRAPNGQILELSTDNGGSGDNYSNTTFCDNATVSIVGQAAPFSGVYRPEGSLTSSACGTNITPTVTTLGGFTAGQNGTWELVIKDDLGGDTGTMLNWSLSFADPACSLAGVTLPTLNLPGNDPNSCGVTDASITAPTLACGVQLLSVYIDGAFYLNVSSGSAFTVTLGNGSYTLTYQLSACDATSQTVNVVDGIKPVIACPGDVTINLAPGLCTTIFNYDVTVTDNCPFFGPVSALTNHPTPIPNTSFFNSFDGCTFDLRNDGTDPIQITGFRSFFTPAVSQTVKVWYTTSATTNVGNQTNPGAWTLLGTVQVTGNNATSFAGADVDVPVGGLVLAPGESKGLYIETQASAAMRYTNGNFTATDGKLTILSNGFAGAANFGNTFASRAFVGTVSYQSVADPTPMQTAGLASGAEFPIGTTTNCFSVSDAAGNIGTCCFNVTVNDYPNPITTLACNDLVQISLDASCSHCIGADEVLEGGPYSCYDNYIVELDKTLPLGNGPWVPGCLSASDLGKTYAVRVTDPATGNSLLGSGEGGRQTRSNRRVRRSDASLQRTIYCSRCYGTVQFEHCSSCYSGQPNGDRNGKRWWYSC
ncbi:MAG: proprotein convertase P-domain-containing protein [Lewinellaceae bacterium]|nr:proprotein convertase P-domain-containing protein [Lewinellaceae bacterium]